MSMILLTSFYLNLIHSKFDASICVLFFLLESSSNLESESCHLFQAALEFELIPAHQLANQAQIQVFPFPRSLERQTVRNVIDSIKYSGYPLCSLIYLGDSRLPHSLFQIGEKVERSNLIRELEEFQLLSECFLQTFNDLILNVFHKEWIEIFIQTEIDMRNNLQLPDKIF